MTPTLRLLTVAAISIATATGVAQEPQLPTGNWRSSASATYTNPALTGAELYRLPDALALATAEVLAATALTCDRAWQRARRRARVV